ncbi:MULTISPECIES: RHS repeat-associated core domain-containing protein [unclassified Pseudomonas]|jgi:RHS repeat-associated protein|uniref:RHS repeat-associated core domain-containing protein n=1 Tax=Pseudomonas sp. A-R-26 TaxID=2832404 RepID=UPI003988C16C
MPWQASPALKLASNADFAFTPDPVGAGLARDEAGTVSTHLKHPPQAIEMHTSRWVAQRPQNRRPRPIRPTNPLIYDCCAAEREQALATIDRCPRAFRHDKYMENLAVLLVPNPCQTANTELPHFGPSEQPPMTSPRETVLCQYHYDPLDRLTSHALPDTPERQRFYCKSRLATEVQGAMRYSIVQHGDQLLAQQRSEGDIPDTKLLVTDQQRSVLQTLKADRPTQPIAYSPYGHRPDENGLLSLLGFNGERPDPVTGHYLLGNGYRAFNPVLMRFNSPDSWSPFGRGGLNSYAYCLGDPINRHDRNGHTPYSFMTAIPTYLKKSILHKIQNSVSLSKLPKKMRYKSELIKKQVAEKIQTSTREGALLEKAVKDSGDIKPLTFTTDPKLSTAQYFQHQKQGVSFDKNGIPNPKTSITMTNALGQETLRTDFFDDSFSFFHHQAQGNGPEPYKTIMSEAAGKTLIRRAQYIRDHALRNYQDPS